MNVSQFIYEVLTGDTDRGVTPADPPRSSARETVVMAFIVFTALLIFVLGPVAVLLGWKP